MIWAALLCKAKVRKLLSAIAIILKGDSSHLKGFQRPKINLSKKNNCNELKT